MIKKVLKFLMLLLVRFYQYGISPYKPPTCRHVPTCSAYAFEAINRFGPFKGGALAVNRVLRCHPLGTHGFDPVPVIWIHKFYVNKRLSCNRLKNRKHDKNSE
ncbi:MAG: uncharacterized protein PWR20_2357 [Bacteroidales bacterium]|jgi:hypothetical protein|nr:uncharacterized protein [Bacteroidales bacterium]MDN5330451.1 uncharacterized protein [Bacteroidales bacterium]